VEHITTVRVLTQELDVSLPELCMALLVILDLLTRRLTDFVTPTTAASGAHDTVTRGLMDYPRLEDLREELRMYRVPLPKGT
jgi:hypothetical protein